MSIGQDYPNFGGLAEQYAEYRKAKTVVLPIPYDKTSTWLKGAERGPQALLEASVNLELFDIETGTEVYRTGICTLPPVVCPDEPEAMVEEDYLQRLQGRIFYPPRPAWPTSGQEGRSGCRKDGGDP